MTYQAFFFNAILQCWCLSVKLEIKLSCVLPVNCNEFDTTVHVHQLYVRQKNVFYDVIRDACLSAHLCTEDSLVCITLRLISSLIGVVWLRYWIQSLNADT